MELRDFFRDHRKAALAFSGGADSAWLLWAGLDCGADILPCYVKSQFQPEFELEDARRLCRELGAELELIELDVLSSPAVAENPPERCYHCKSLIMSAVKGRAAEKGYALVIDGSNASDAAGDRPGMRALEEEGILSPLRLCGITKPELRAMSREAGLFTWSKPAYACLATRIEPMVPIKVEDLKRIEAGEALLTARGFSDLRLRLRSGGALLQLTGEQLPRGRAELGEIKELLSPWFEKVELDEKERDKSL